MSSRTTQPGAGVALEVANALNTNLQLVYNPAAYAGDLVNTVPFTAHAGTDVAVNYLGSTTAHQWNNQVSYWPNTVTSIGTSSFTLTLLIRRDAQVNNGIAFSSISTADTSGITINMRDTSVSRNMACEIGTGGIRSHASMALQATNATWYMMSVRRDAATNRLVIVVNGNTMFDAATVPNFVFEGSAVVFGRDTTLGGTYQACTVALLHLVKTALTLGQIGAFHGNPWQVFDAQAASATFEVGAFGLAGNIAQLRVARKLTAARGIFGMTGVDSGGSEFGVNRSGDPMPLPCMMLIGVPAAHYVDEPMPLPCMALGASPASFGFDAAPGVFAVTGYPMSVVGRQLELEAWWGEFAVAGAPATRDMDLTASRATFAEAGVAFAATQANTMAAASGTFALTGHGSTGVPSVAGALILPGELGEFALAGNAATLKQTGYALVAQTGTFAVTFKDATLRGSQWAPIDLGPGVWTETADATTTWQEAA